MDGWPHEDDRFCPIDIWLCEHRSTRRDKSTMHIVSRHGVMDVGHDCPPELVVAMVLAVGRQWVFDAQAAAA